LALALASFFGASLISAFHSEPAWGVVRDADSACQNLLQSQALAIGVM
jgi:hypothetical protein